jgi:hypothetical protein
MKKAATMTRVKGLLVLAPMVLALSAFGAHSSYAYDPYYYDCPSPSYAYPYCTYPYGYSGIWWDHGDHFIHRRGFDHHHFDHGGTGHGHGDFGHGGGHGH